MPFYEIAHTTALTKTQQDALAEAITNIHSTRFTVPRMYINVVFHDTSGIPTYVGGKQKISTNRIVARVRRGTRSQQDFNALCGDIQAAWARIVHPACTADELPPQDLELRAIFITGELIAGMKSGFPVPTAGDERAWAEEHWGGFQRRADAGDEDFVDLVAEILQWPGFVPPAK